MGLIRPRSAVTNTMTKHKVVFLGKAWAWAGCSGLGGPLRRKLPLEPQSSPRLRRRWSNQLLLPAVKAKKCGARFFIVLENLLFRKSQLSSESITTSQCVREWGCSWWSALTWLMKPGWCCWSCRSRSFSWFLFLCWSILIETICWSKYETNRFGLWPLKIPVQWINHFSCCCQVRAGGDFFWG